jgi:hypothetical protein
VDFFVEKSDVSKELNFVRNAIERRNTIPILSHFLLEADGLELKIFGTDSEIAARTVCPAVVNRYTQAPVRFVAGLSLMIRAFEDIYGNLEGRLLEALARLFAQNVRIYAYPMTATELRERLKGISATGWEWSETNGLVSASQLRHAPPLGHLFAYLLASKFIVPVEAPAALRADA